MPIWCLIMFDHHVPWQKTNILWNVMEYPSFVNPNPRDPCCVPGLKPWGFHPERGQLAGCLPLPCGARLSRPQCQTKCQTSLVTETMLEDAACLCTNTSYVCSVRVRSARSQTLHQGDSLSHNRDASARQNLFACWKAVFDKIRFLLCDVFTVLRLGHQTVSLILFRKEASSGLAKSWIHSTVSCSAKGLSCSSDTAFWASYEVWMQTWI